MSDFQSFLRELTDRYIDANQSQSHFAKLPAEISQKILDELSREDFNSVTRTCKKLYEYNAASPRDDLLYPLPEEREAPNPDRQIPFYREPNYGLISPFTQLPVHSRDPQKDLVNAYLLARNALSNPETAGRIRSIRVTPISNPWKKFVDDPSIPDYEALRKFEEDLPNAKYIESLDFELPRTSLSYQTLSKLQGLKRLRVPYVSVHRLHGLYIEELTIDHRYVRDIHTKSNGTIGNLPALKTLHLLEFEDGGFENGGQLPLIDFDTLPRLERFKVIGANFIPQITRHTSKLSHVDIERGDRAQSLSWLRYTTRSLRHLALTDISNESLPATPLSFDNVLSLELYWCDVPEFSKKMHFPKVTCFSESREIVAGQHLRPLQNARPFLNKLKLLALRFEYDLRTAPKIWHDISNVYDDLQRLKTSGGCLERCLIQGSVASPPTSWCSWIRYQKRDDTEGEHFQPDWRERAIEKRSELLRWLDPEAQFRETQDPKRFYRSAPWL